MRKWSAWSEIWPIRGGIARNISGEESRENTWSISLMPWKLVGSGLADRNT